MKKIFFLTILTCLTLKVHAQIERVYGNAVPVQLWLVGEMAAQESLGGWKLETDGYFLPSTPGGSDGVKNIFKYQTSSWPNVQETTADFGTVRVTPYKPVTIMVNAQYLLSLVANVTAPQGYRVKIEGSIGTGGDSFSGSSTRLTYANSEQNIATNGTITFSVEPVSQQGSPSPAGTSTSLIPGRMEWRLSMGASLNGESAGELVLMDPADGDNWNLIFNTNSLSLVEQYKEAKYMGASLIGGKYYQLYLSNEAAVRIDQRTDAFEVAFFTPAQLTITEPLIHTYTGEPFVTYLVEKGSTDTSIIITQTTRNVANATSTGLSAATTKTTTMTRTGTAPEFTWEVQDWTKDGETALVVHEAVVTTNSSGDRVVTYKTKGPGTSGIVALTSIETYHNYPWGECLLSREVGSELGLTSTYDYYDNLGASHLYGRPKSKSASDGGWESYVYASTTTNRFAASIVSQRNRPWQTLGESITTNVNEAESATFSYTEDVFGYPTRPGGMYRKIGGVEVERMITTYSSDGTFGGMNMFKAIRKNYVHYENYNSESLTTTTRYFREDTIDPFYRNKAHAVTLSDGTKTSYVYQRGTWNGTSFSPSASNGITPAAGSRLVTIHGTVSTGDSYTEYDGGNVSEEKYDVDDVSLVTGKSSMDVEIRNSRAQLARTERHIWNGSSDKWQLVGYTNYTYDFFGRLEKTEDSMGRIADCGYNGFELTSKTDAEGISVSYTYDAAGRVDTATKAAATGITALTTKFGYDASAHITSERIGWTSASPAPEQLVTLRAFDTAGRLTSETPAGLGQVTHDYDVAARTHTVNRPHSSSAVETQYRDGTIKSMTGSGVVPVYYERSVETNGDITYLVKGGLESATTSRWSKTTRDWLGRVVSTERPGFSKSSQANFVETNTYASGTDWLTKTVKTGLSPSLYAHDAFGEVTLSGLDVTATDTLVLASNDRVTSQDTTVQHLTGEWWSVTEVKTYPIDNNDTPVTTTTKTKLTGMPTGRISEIVEIDAESNETTRITQTNRSTKTTTITTIGDGGYSIIEQKSVNGLPTSVTSRDGLTTTTQYDDLSRASVITDSRANTATSVYYTGSPLIEKTTTAVTSAVNAVTTNAYDDLGRVKWSKNAAGKYTRFDYNPRGQVLYQWGDATYPIAYGYDADFGDRTSMKTYRAAPSADSTTWPTVGTPDTTAWIYDGVSGLLWKKQDAKGEIVELDYNSRGQISSRKLARTLSSSSEKLKVSYGYYDTTGELHTVSYNDSTETVPTGGLTYGYTRAGRVSTVSDATGSRSFNYDSSKPWRLSSEALSSFYGSKQITQLYEDSNSSSATFGSYAVGTRRGRPVGFELGTSLDSDSDLHQHYTYSNLHRLVGVTSRTGSLAGQDFIYSYTASSGLLDGYTAGNLTISRDYEPKRDVLARIEAKWSGSSLTRFDYTADILGRRETAKQSGTAFADYFPSSYTSVFHHYAYNSKNELQTAASYRGDTIPAVGSAPSSTNELPGRRFEYRYDSVGNRQTAGATGSASTSDDEYSTNGVNQYTFKENNALRVIGTVGTTANTKVAVDGAATTILKDRTWGAQIARGSTEPARNGSVNIFTAIVGGGTAGADLVGKKTRSYLAPPAAQDFSYDPDGNLKGDGLWTYIYDAENRLRMMTSTLAAEPGNTRHQIEFLYDYLGRRVQKTVTNLDTSAVVTRRFLYDGWNLVAELNAGGTQLVRSYAWGLDQSGTLDRTGGIGALLRITYYSAGLPSSNYYPAYNGNGDVSCLIDASTGALAAVYEYDPFGDQLRAEALNPIVADNPFRFSSKYWDNESGLSYYGYRYYNPSLGRFINQDPVGESGGANLYGFVGNNAINQTDYLGMVVIDTIILDPFQVTGKKPTGTEAPSITLQGWAWTISANFIGSYRKWLNPGLSDGNGFPAQYTLPTAFEKNALEIKIGGASRFPNARHPALQSDRSAIIASIESAQKNLRALAREAKAKGDTRAYSEAIYRAEELEGHKVLIRNPLTEGDLSELNRLRAFYGEFQQASTGAKFVMVFLHYPPAQLAALEVLLPVIGKLSAAETTAARTNFQVYEVLSERTVSGTTRAAHRAAANRALLNQLDNSPELASMFKQQLDIDIGAAMRLGKSGPLNPPGTVWHHPVDNPNVVQLLRQLEHTNPALQPVLHPQGIGGFGTFYGP
ncbi:RHS repeat-associated core domain-containing protein [Oleiharenicola lentus]|uniref:RHS repeat-associated core domain-containing protein n=1 Tax=Oleiharenicola lentus TaxID=2508720 RepID=UPI003F66BD32